MTLLQMSVMGGMMVLAFALLRALVGRYFPRRAFLWMWTAALCRLLIPVRISSGWSVFHLLRKSGQAVMAGTAGDPAPVITVPGGIAAAPEVETAFVPSLLPVIWLVGAALVGGYLLLAWLHWRGRFRRAVPVEISGWREDYPLRRPLEIRQLEGLRTPLTYGVLRPVILLPLGQVEGEKEQLRCILTHEYVHIRRFDALRKLALAAAVTLHWFNPAVWLLFHLASRDMELYCDELALERLGEEQRKNYAFTLLRSAEQQAERIPLCSFFGKPMIEERILMMKQKKNATVFAAVLAAVLLVGVTTAFATTAEKAEEPPYRGTAEAVDVETPPVVAEPIEPESGELIWPAEGCDTVSCPFGKANPVTGVTTDHITIAGEKGANILAAAGGTIIDSGWRNTWGNYLEIDHGNGLVTFYTHLEDIYVSRDTAVEQGQVIATLGQSGTATGPCLGFYVSTGGVTVDPMEWFAQ